jgi:hypothetical protein
LPRSIGKEGHACKPSAQAEPPLTHRINGWTFTVAGAIWPVVSKRHVQWLFQELPTLVSSGIVTEATAERLRQHYGTGSGKPIQSKGSLAYG